MSMNLPILRHLSWQFGFSFGHLDVRADARTGQITRRLHCTRWPRLNVEHGPAGEAASEQFVRRIRQSQQAGQLEMVSQNIDQLDEVIANLERRVEQLQGLIDFACRVRDSHEPAAERRGRGES